MIQNFAVALQPEEQTLLDGITFEYEGMGYQAFRDQGERVATLVKALLARGAIPEQRLRWFTDGAYYPGGRGKSRKDVFHRNGNTEEEILRHASFLKHLRYFLFGTDLPKPVVERFAHEVEGCGMVTSGDVIPLGKTARKLIRDYGLERHHAADEFHKLALDLGVSNFSAVMIHGSVKR